MPVQSRSTARHDAWFALARPGSAHSLGLSVCLARKVCRKEDAAVGYLLFLLPKSLNKCILLSLAKVAELVDALDLESSAFVRGGSTPPFRTK